MRRLICCFIFCWVTLLPVQAMASVKCVQEFLSQTPFDPGPVDGAWGKKTATALEGFFTQVSGSVDGGLGKGNVEEICAVLNGDQHDEWLISAALRLYPVKIDPNQVSIAVSRTDFNFSKSDIADAQNWQCNFVISRDLEGEDDVERLAKGKLEIVDGQLEFRKHQWYTGGMSDDTFLTDDANLMLTKSGKIVGKIPYFHLYVDRGDVALQPLYPTLSTDFEEIRKFPEGESAFHVEAGMLGIFKLWGCKEPSS